MKIIQFTDSFIPVTDGVGSVVYQYALDMAKKGHEVYVVAPQTDTGYRGGLPFELVDYVGFNLAKLKSYKAGFPALDPHCQSRLNMIHADIVHVHTPFTAGQAGILYAQNHKVPVIGTFHSNYYDDILQMTGIELLATVGSKYVGGFYNKCDEVWAVSRHSAQTIQEYGCEKPIKVMANGTDVILPDPKVEKRISKQYGLNGRPVLLYMGQMNWKKNIRCILLAAGLLELDYRLVLAGAGPHEEEIRELAEEIGIADKVILTGFISDEAVKTALFARADLFVFPSVYDTSGLVVKEAAAAGTPSVTVRKSGASEGIKNGVNGFLCKDSPVDLAKVITDALADREVLQTAGKTAHDTIPVPWEVITNTALTRYKYIIRHYKKEE
ncbi:MAG: glycosyltransferase [Lachnospiraceae bacterium]|nr:glycosyltransferase [Lachnospiraceae bacterium]